MVEWILNLKNVVIITPNLVFRLDFIHEAGGAVVTADEVLNLLESSVIILGIITKTISLKFRNPIAQISVKTLQIPIAAMAGVAASCRGGEEGGSG